MKAIVFVLAFFGLLALALASSHGEALGVINTPQLDITDVYAFVSYEPGRENYTTILTNVQGFQDNQQGPNYHLLSGEASYNVYIDQDGDAQWDLVYSFLPANEFNNGGRGAALPVGPVNNASAAEVVPLALRIYGQIKAGQGQEEPNQVIEYYRLQVTNRATGTKNVVRARTGNPVFRKPTSFSGTKTFSDYNAYANQFIYEVTIPDCATTGRVFVGQRKEPFFINLGPTFDLVNYVPIDFSFFAQNGFNASSNPGLKQSKRYNTLRRYNVHTLALEVPSECLVGNGNGVIGVWAGTSFRSGRRVNRLANPLVNELFIGLKAKDAWSVSTPADDAQFATYVTYPTIPEVINILFKDAVNALFNLNLTTLAPQNFPRNDLVAVFLTGIPGLNQQSTVVPSDQLRLNTRIPPTPRFNQSNFGVIGGDLAGFPNGRRLGDDVVDMALTVAMGRVCHLGLGVCNPSDAPIGTVPLTDGAPVRASDFQNQFPYANPPRPGNLYN